MKRALLVVFCVLCMVQEAGTIPLTMRFVGYTGALPDGRVAPFHWRLELIPGYAAQKAGLRDGDIIDARSLDGEQRFRVWSTALFAGKPVIFSVLRGAGVERIPVTPQLLPIPWALWVAIAAGFWTAICALVLVVRRGADRGVQLLVLYMLLVRLSIQMAPSNWVTPYPVADLINAVLNEVMPAGWALLAAYSASFASANRGVGALAWASYALAFYIAAAGAAAPLAAWFAFADPLAPYFAGAPYFIAQAVYFVVPLACAIEALRAARGPARERLAWLLLPTVVIYAIYLSYIAASYVPALNSDAFTALSLVLQLLAPLGITYAMLNRRLLDIGFALNRAAVYAGVSLVIVGVFVLVEWAFGEWFSSATHAENLLVSAGLALVLGFSVRAIHQRVDGVLDRAFFRKRHEDEAALRRFAHEAPYITDAAILLGRAEETLSQHADASFVNFAIDDGSGQYGGVSENDPALVTIRASRAVLDLTTMETMLKGEYAYPMIARGRVFGALAIGPKRSGESYAPDESQAIAEVAHGVATSLDVLVLSKGRREDAILDGIAELRREIAALGERVLGEQKAST